MSARACCLRPDYCHLHRSTATQCLTLFICFSRPTCLVSCRVVRQKKHNYTTVLLLAMGQSLTGKKHMIAVKPAAQSTCHLNLICDYRDSACTYIWRLAKLCSLYRPYKRLKEYEFPEEQALLRWKLQTSKHGGCQGQSCKPGQLGTYNMELGCFQTGCPCLAQNTECDAACACKPPGGAGDAQGCANRAASERRVLQLGQDVQEIDPWGLACYTRNNIHDGTAADSFCVYQHTLELPVHQSCIQ